ncbi:MAG: DeoR family transcriptional regulator [Anaerolineaceae bacterium]|nr:DeoR family transcriptional regulator [Anaerolineaceae bacterium]
MLKEERQQHLLDALKRDGKVVAVEISAALNVSEDTIRRDLNELAEAGLLRRVHGGAVTKALTETAYINRSQQHTEAKSSIAQAAAQLVQDGQVILLDCGTTTTRLAELFPYDLRATVITNSPPAVMALAEHPYLDVILLGGTLNKATLATIGAETAAALSRFRADICFLGVNGLHIEAGITDFSYEEAQLKRIMIENSASVVALASADKLGTVAPFVLAPIASLTHLVTESGVTDDVLLPFSQSGIIMIKA